MQMRLMWRWKVVVVVSVNVVCSSAGCVQSLGAARPTRDQRLFF